MLWGLLILLALVVAVPLLLKRPPRVEKLRNPELEAAEKRLADEGEKEWVVLTRFSGPAYTHNAMSEIISELTSRGVEATYDVISTSMAEAGVTNYMLKVLPGSEEAAREILAEMNDRPSGASPDPKS